MRPNCSRRRISRSNRRCDSQDIGLRREVREKRGAVLVNSLRTCREERRERRLRLAGGQDAKGEPAHS